MTPARSFRDETVQRRQGYGFIAPDDATADVFVHQSAIEAEGHRGLQENQRVEYAARQGPKGPHSEQVQPL